VRLEGLGQLKNPNSKMGKVFKDQIMAISNSQHSHGRTEENYDTS
jgi:hypothetical protein